MSTTEEMPDPLAVWTLINSHVVARCIHMVADFGVPDALDGEPASADELAARTGVDADALARMLWLLSAHSLFAASPAGWVHTPRSELLRSDHPQSLRSFARMIVRTRGRHSPSLPNRRAPAASRWVGRR